eukprot:scaffold20429_cov102-Isochrysis_galbana.AAC.3
MHRDSQWPMAGRTPPSVRQLLRLATTQTSHRRQPRPCGAEIRRAWLRLREGDDPRDREAARETRRRQCRPKCRRERGRR